jgi:hypothetical protein
MNMIQQTEELLRETAKSGLTLDWWISLAILIVAAISGYLGGYLKAYLEKKGQNLATKEDFKEMLIQLKQTTTATEEIKAEIAAQTMKATQEEQERKKINLQYLNPLRLYLEENHFRINEILNRVEANHEKTKWLLTRLDAKAVSEQNAQWFNGEGCYLISTCYLTACLFYQVKRVREDLPYLRLGENEDTKLLNLMHKVSLAFLQHVGIFYVTQPSIGNDMYLPDKNRLISYREFCRLLQHPETSDWFDRLINFYIDAGKGYHLDRMKNVIETIQALSEFLDNAVGGGTSIGDRYLSEGINFKAAN